ncbi:hypothetical protein TraAM80_02537 [Trypanosoma rangeli]|uniref:Uncharacterized protein n=1 Tax=Trypanosoma rangeli TaxID=5698 RepID=A0A422NTL7_TRYRA|nr:uncharacterized protein TraAM80_02537 [Trypanosoma rangeli]RNF08796.1 hypothetical protein TraAM80_02537 [Trypanosoma rangeli]|eukprot:RNF08796.1 hypothetical protein TraAM80_02537 [Trypanosoma rangeli]
MFPAATREEVVRWGTLLHDALHTVGLAPTPAVVAALNTLTSYAESPLTRYSDPERGARTAKAHGALLLALHTATSPWPAVLLRRLALPPVRIADRDISVSGPAMEVFVVLYNAAISNCNAGIAAMERVQVNYTRGATRNSRASASLSGDTKAAFNSFHVGAELAAYGEQALLTEESENLLTPADCDLIQQNFNFRTLRETADFCKAVAKYAHATTSHATSKQHNALAKLAHSAYTVGLSAAHVLESLRFLPQLLLAAYHRHRAEHYNSAAEVLDMSLALGHIAYAWRLVKELEEEELASSMAASAAFKEKMRQSGGWKLLGRLSATLVGSQTAKAGGTADGDLPAQPFRKLEELLEESDLVRVFPLAHILLHDIATLHDKYQHENSVVYYERPAREEVVIADAPAVETLNCFSTPSEYVPLAIKLSADMTKFGEMPSGERLEELLQQQEATRGMQDSVRKQLEDVQGLVHEMELALLLPSSVESELSALEALLHRDRGVVVTLDERFEEAYESVAQALQRCEKVNGELCRVKKGYRGKNVAVAVGATALRQRERAWHKRADAVRAALAKELPHCGEAALREALLLPAGAALRLCITQAKVAMSRAKETIARHAPHTDACAVHLAELRSIRKESVAALEQMASLRTPNRWGRVACALSDAAEVIITAEKFVEAVEAELQLTETLKDHIVPTTRHPAPDGPVLCSESRKPRQTPNTLLSKAVERRPKRARSSETQSDEEEEEDEEVSGEKAVESPPEQQRKGVPRKAIKRTRQLAEEEAEDRSPPALAKMAKAAAHSANTAEMAHSSETVRIPEAIVSASLLERLRRRQQELGADGEKAKEATGASDRGVGKREQGGKRQRQR